MVAASMGHVLVVEDDADIRESVCEMLEDEGFDVVTAKDGREALGLLHGGARPCVILTDLFMPQMSGQEFVSAIRRIDELASIPLVCISGMPNFKLPGVDVMLKPFNLDQLLSFVQKYCAHPRQSAGPEPVTTST